MGDTIKISEGANGREIEAASGQMIEISLPENPTTGFRWRLESNGEPVVALQSDAFAASGGPPGAGGIHHWRFQAVQPGSARLAFALGRSWQATAPPAKTFSVGVRVAPGDGR